ncbi:hypothetical protein Dda_4846 [Drechslerella dactyloides]|uniref:Extracellular membrane protein CFEM domain-containing protein n=1 Tax=Drechslerella dactyloides TaxID=74499 RepID=A0AAD6NJR3_DREDA|nr:hypothetical protein Dda_4846 [Drechslerella dactyloides]
MSQLFLPAVVSALALFASLTNGQVPTAVVSVVSDSDYATARPCIQTCIWYNGGLGRGGNSGFQDVGKALGCGQMPINACYCSDRLTASATSYFSVCISSLCTAATDPADLSSALSIYGRYCSTAGVVEAAPTTTSAGTSTSPGSSTRTSVASTSGDRSSSGQTGSTRTDAESCKFWFRVFDEFEHRKLTPGYRRIHVFE